MDLEVWDTWSYNWNSLNFSSKNSYKFLQVTQEASPLFSWLWSAGNLGKQIFVLAPHERPTEHKKLAKKEQQSIRWLQLCHLNALSTWHAGTTLVSIGTWTSHPWIWLLKLELHLEATFLEQLSSRLAGSFGTREMDWSLTTCRALLPYGMFCLER